MLPTIHLEKYSFRTNPLPSKLSYAKLKTLQMDHMICIFMDGLKPDQALTLGGLKVLLVAAQFVSRFNLSVCLCMIV